MPSSLTWVLPLVLGFSPRLPVSVCGTGTLSLLSSFSRQREFNSFPTYFQSPSRPRIVKRSSLLNSLIAWTRSTSHALCLSSVSLLQSNAKGGTGISTSCPSPTTFVLGLGPDLPWVDEPSPGNLGLSTCKFLACISLLIPAFSLL